MARAPELSRFELQCLGKLLSCGTASVRDVHRALVDPPGYSAIKKIFERLEAKGAVERVGRSGNAWLYRSRVSRAAMAAKEIRRLVDALFDGRAGSLVAHLADMDALTLDDLRQAERALDAGRSSTGRKRKSGRRGG
jgi:predicted transcriptional regulator